MKLYVLLLATGIFISSCADNANDEEATGDVPEMMAPVLSDPPSAPVPIDTVRKADSTPKVKDTAEKGIGAQNARIGG